MFYFEEKKDLVNCFRSKFCIPLFRVDKAGEQKTTVLVCAAIG